MNANRHLIANLAAKARTCESLQEFEQQHPESARLARELGVLQNLQAETTEGDLSSLPVGKLILKARAYESPLMLYAKNPTLHAAIKKACLMKEVFRK